ncbi:MAG TPA: ATP-binding protein [Gemmatimonadales bacterium]|jgi:two-component system OmpR family sensor kinase|nr:ATP-binding protein [Gemmatimonadales bacterium]
MRSFRSALALRVAVQALVLAVVVVAGATLVLRASLLAGVDVSLREVAEVEARGGATLTSNQFQFRPDIFALGDPRPVLRPWAQLLSFDGTPGARSGNLTESLPVPRRALGRARQGLVGFETHRWNRTPVRTAIFPLRRVNPAYRGHLLQISASLDPVNATVFEFFRFTLALGGIAVGLAWLIGSSIARRAIHPALALTAEAEAIQVSELGRRVTEPADFAEFNRMAVALNELLARIERAVNGTRRFTADASHELRAPLTVLRGEIELALSRIRTAAEYEEALRRGLDEVLRLARLADDLLTLARLEGGVLGGKRDVVELDEVVERSIAKKAGLAAAREVRIEVSGTAGFVSADDGLLLRAMDGLLERAILASPRGGQIRVVLANGPSASVEVSDSGVGLKAEEVSGVFQRFYRSGRPRSASEESGLGLPIARAIAERHGGGLDYTGNTPGASFRLSLPAAPPPPSG